MSSNAADSFNVVARELVGSVTAAFSPRPSLSGFILLYASIDIFASLTRPKEKPETDSACFKAWVKKYMLPGSGLRCDENDLWGARCGILHSMRVESKSSATRTARMINYIDDSEMALLLQQRYDPMCQTEIIISTQDLFQSFKNGVTRFIQDIESDGALKNRVLAHSENLIVPELHTPNSLGKD